MLGTISEPGLCHGGVPRPLSAGRRLAKEEWLPSAVVAIHSSRRVFSSRPSICNTRQKSPAQRAAGPEAHSAHRALPCPAMSCHALPCLARGGSAAAELRERRKAQRKAARGRTAWCPASAPPRSVPSRWLRPRPASSMFCVFVIIRPVAPRSSPGRAVGIAKTRGWRNQNVFRPPFSFSPRPSPAGRAGPCRADGPNRSPRPGPEH